MMRKLITFAITSGLVVQAWKVWRRQQDRRPQTALEPDAIARWEGEGGPDTVAEVRQFDEPRAASS